MSILNQMQNDITNKQTTTAKLVYLDVNDLIANPLNKDRILHDVNLFAENIRSLGLQQPIVVTKKEGKNIIVTGHKRASAIAMIVEKGLTYSFNGKELQDEIPAFIIDVKSEFNERLALLQSNAFNDETRDEKVVRAKEAESLYEILVAEGKKPVGLKRDWIQSQTGYSARSVQDYLKEDLGNAVIAENINDTKEEKKASFNKILSNVKKMNKTISDIDLNNLEASQKQLILDHLDSLVDTIHELTS